MLLRFLRPRSTRFQSTITEERVQEMINNQTIKEARVRAIVDECTSRFPGRIQALFTSVVLSLTVWYVGKQDIAKIRQDVRNLPTYDHISTVLHGLRTDVDDLIHVIKKDGFQVGK